jgi:hypothetical protein
VGRADPPARTSWRRYLPGGHTIAGQVVAGTIAAVVGGILLLVVVQVLFGEDQPGSDVSEADTTGSSAAPTTIVPSTTPHPPVDLPGCDERACPVLTVVDTVEAGRDEGLYVKACFDTATCERLALAQLHQRVHAQCRVEGGFVVEDGVATWVRVPWRFTGSVAPDGSANAAATGESDSSADTYGWMSARYLAPAPTIAALPLCF